jgi:hypothetical protein
VTRNARIAAIVAVAVFAIALMAALWIPTDPVNDAAKNRHAAQERTIARRLQAACSSRATYDRLKQVAFDEAIRIRNADPVNLDTLATYSTVRMEEPRVKSRDETLDVTVCTGRLVLDIPPGAERAFGGERQLVADVEYAAQAAADGSGLVYQLKGAEPIIYKLAAFDLKSQAYRPAAGDAPVRTARADAPVGLPTDSEPPPVPRVDTPPPPPVVAERPVAAPRPAANPSFDCSRARTRSERMVCGDAGLAELDREMSSRFYAALDQGGSGTRNALRKSRDRFLAYRDRCRDSACVAQAYRDRMDEIRDIAAGR